MIYGRQIDISQSRTFFIFTFDKTQFGEFWIHNHKVLN